MHVKRHMSHGYTLVELIVVLVIVSLLVLGMLSYVQRANASHDAQDEIQALSMLVTTARQYRVAGTYGTGDMLPLLVQGKRVATGNILMVDGNTVTNQWGGGITLTAKNKTFDITDEKLPYGVCVTVLTGMGNLDQGIDVSLGGKTLPRTKGVIHTSDAADACEANDGAKVTFAGYM